MVKSGHKHVRKKMGKENEFMSKLAYNMCFKASLTLKEKHNSNQHNLNEERNHGFKKDSFFDFRGL